LSEEKKYKNYTATDIEKYHRGLLSARERNELEKAALDDPFLADALEGYAATANISSDLSELEKKLEQRVTDKKVISIAPTGNSFKWWKVAAAVFILGGLGYFIFQVSTGKKNKEVAAKLEEKKITEPASQIRADSNRSIAVESTSVAATDKQVETTTKSNLEKKKAASPHAEANKNDLTSGITEPAPSNTYPQSNDSIIVDRSLGVKAPGAAEKRSVAADDKGNQGYLSSKKEVSSNNSRQANYFNGRIKDANNNPLPFANITNTRDNVGTYADAQGRFTLVSPDSVLNVQVRSVGFENSTVQLKNSLTSNDVVLREDNTTPNKVLSFQKPDTSRSRMANMKFEELEPADGWSNYNTYLANNINLPEDLRRKETVKGQVQLSFEVNQQGDPINIRVERSLCVKCDEEAVRVVKQGPKWKKKNKKANRITISVPFDTQQ